MAKDKDLMSLFEEEASGLNILTDKEILRAIQGGQLITHDTFLHSSVEAASYDIRVGFKGTLGGIGAEVDLKTGMMELQPGGYAGVVSYEKFNFPSNVAARIGAKKALSYEGIILLSGSLVDPGYKGHLIFGLYNASQKKVIIRSGRKIANIVFEKLATSPDRQPPEDANLLRGEFPDGFIDKMANMEVLPWMQISERVKQIENITKDIIDLKARYEDVLQPIKQLTENVNTLSKDISALTTQTKSLTDDLEKVNHMVNENGKQIGQLTANLGIVSTQVQGLQGHVSTFSTSMKSSEEKLVKIESEVSKYKWLVVVAKT